MKKIIALLLASTLVIGALSACTRNEPEPEVPSSSEEVSQFVYKNGTYSVRYGFPALDRTLDFLTLSITDDVITVDDYGMKEMEEPVSSEGASSGEAVSSAASSSQAASSAASGTSSLEATEHEATAAEAAKDILEEFKIAGNDVDKMEIIVGAEEHSYRFMRMVRTLLEQAKSGDTATAVLGQYADGDYESTMPSPNIDGWTEFIKLTVKDGSVSSLDYNAMKGNDPAVLITADEELNKGTTKPSEYYPQIAKNFEEAGGDLSNMLSPSGGGEATKTFGKLMNPLMINMISGGDTKITATRFVDGTYKAQFKEFDENGWKEYVVLTIKNGEVTVKEFDAISKADETKLKSADTEVTAKMEEKTGTNFVKAADELISSLKGANNDVTKVDNVAGATISSNSFKLLVGQILVTTALEGDNKSPLEIDRMDTK